MPINLHKPHEPRICEFAKGRNFCHLPFALRRGGGHTMFLGRVDGGVKTLGEHGKGAEPYIMRVRHDRLGREVAVIGKKMPREMQDGVSGLLAAHVKNHRSSFASLTIGRWNTGFQKIGLKTAAGMFYKPLSHN